MKAAVASLDEIAVVESDVFAAAVMAILVAFAVVEDYAIAAAADDFEGTQSYHCTDYSLLEQLAGKTDTASAVEHDWHTENPIHHSDFESVGIAGELKTVSKDPQL